MFYVDNLEKYFIGFYIILFLFWINYLLDYNKPKRFKKVNFIKPKYKRKDIDKDRYKKSKIPNDIDTIVIGSGIGGLSCAALLSRVGKKVLVLEQHYIAGGCMHVFEDKGIEHETGIHYIGNINKRQKILNTITEKPIEWCKMGRNTNDVYDEIYIGDNRYCFRAGKNNFVDDLVKKFPDEEENIKIYLELVKEVAKEDLFFSLKIINNRFLSYILKLYLKYWKTNYFKYLNRTTYDVISDFTNNEELKAVLCGQFGDHGIPPKKSNFFIHSNIVYHYLEGGYFPKGGPSTITKNIIPIIENSGGRVLVGKSVRDILIENNKAIGVEMENGDKIYSKNVISAVGVNTTFNKLVNHEISFHYQELVETIKSSTGFVYCFVNLNGTSEELELRDSNLWIYPDRDFDNLIENFEDDMLNSPMPLFISSSSAKDSTWNERYPNKSSIILLTPAKKEHFLRWETEECMKRNLDYKDFKEELGQRMLKQLYKYYPKTKDKVYHYDVGTPLTNQYYLGVINGEGYGLESTSERYSSFDLKPETKIKNLYLTGQDICTLGFTGALMGGVLTAHSVLGYGTIFDVIYDRNLITDLDKIKLYNI